MTERLSAAWELCEDGHMSFSRLSLAAASLVLFVSSGCDKRGAEQSADASAVEATRALEGSVLQAAESQRVYLITHSKRHYIPTPATLQALGVANQVKTASDSLLNAIPLGSDLPALDSPLIQKANTGEVFILEAGKRRYIPNTATLAAVNIAKRQIRGVSGEVADTIPLGQPVPPTP